MYGYFSQAGIQLKEDKRVIEVPKDIAEVIVMADGRKVTASQLLLHLCLPQKCSTPMYLSSVVANAEDSTY